MRSELVERFAERPVLRRVALPVAAFVAITVLGVAAFVQLAGVGVVESLFWLLDPTSIAFHFQRAPGTGAATKVVAVVVAAGQVLTTLWAAESVLGAVLGGQISEEIRRAQEEQDIMETEDHVIVCGYGMFGRTVADELAGQGFDVLVVEVQEDQADRARHDGYLAVTGDARQEAVLREAEIQDASALVSAVDDSNVNIQVAIVADELSPDLETTVRVGEEMYESVARRAGADHVVIPEIMTGDVVASRIQESSAPARHVS